MLPGLSPHEMGELADARMTMSHWIAEPLSKVTYEGLTPNPRKRRAFAMRPFMGGHSVGFTVP